MWRYGARFRCKNRRDLEGLRSLALDGWQWGELAQALVAIAVVGAVSMSLCFGALRGRLRQA